ncbi:hypothetical protein KKH3_13800 [Pectobacterium actinidiae]|nr:hypothetical protein KKH3_13800 [Pectobacterium actinidiae]
MCEVFFSGNISVTIWDKVLANSADINDSGNVICTLRMLADSYTEEG